MGKRKDHDIPNLPVIQKRKYNHLQVRDEIEPLKMDLMVEFDIDKFVVSVAEEFNKGIDVGFIERFLSKRKLKSRSNFIYELSLYVQTIQHQCATISDFRAKLQAEKFKMAEIINEAEYRASQYEEMKKQDRALTKLKEAEAEKVRAGARSAIAEAKMKEEKVRIMKKESKEVYGE